MVTLLHVHNGQYLLCAFVWSFMQFIFVITNYIRQVMLENTNDSAVENKLNTTVSEITRGPFFDDVYIYTVSQKTVPTYLLLFVCQI